MTRLSLELEMNRDHAYGISPEPMPAIVSHCHMDVLTLGACGVTVPVTLNEVPLLGCDRVALKLPLNPNP